MRSLIYAVGCSALLGFSLTVKAAEDGGEKTSDAAVEMTEQETNQPQTDVMEMPFAYPEAVCERPTVLPVGGVLASVSLSAGSDDKHNLTVTEVAPSVAYGISRRLEGSLTYSSPVNDQELRTVKPSLSYFLFGKEPLWVALKGAVPVFLRGDALRSFNVGVSAFFVPVSRLVVYTNDLRFYVDSTSETTVNLPVDLNVGYQLTDKVWVSAKTYVATLNLKGGKTTTFVDRTPAYLQSTVSLGRMFDVGFSAGFDDAQSPRKTLAVGVSTTYKGM